MATKDIDNLGLQMLYKGLKGESHHHIVEWSGSALPNGDSVRLMHCPQGMRIINIEMIVNDAADASTTLDIGLVQKGSGSFTDDADKFFDGVGISSTALSQSVSNTHHMPVTIEEPNVFLEALLGGAAISQAFKIGFIVHFDWVGNP